MAQFRCNCLPGYCHKESDGLKNDHFCAKDSADWDNPIMTRDEALNKLIKIFNVDGGASTFLQACEALGLVEFEEEKELTPAQIIDSCFVMGNGAVKVYEEFKKHGYMIIKKGKNISVTLDQYDSKNDRTNRITLSGHIIDIK